MRSLRPVMKTMVSLWAILLLSSSVALRHIAANEARVITVKGTVTDPEQRPVSDCTVYLPVPGSDGEVEVLTAQTDAQGSWSFALAKQPTSDVVVLAFQPGLAWGVAVKKIFPMWGTAHRLAPGESVELPIRLTKPSRMKVRLIDDQGAPVSNARVGLTAMGEPNGNSYFYWGEPRVAALAWTSSSAGEFTIEELPRTGIASLQVATAEYGDQNITIDLTQAATEIMVSLRPVGHVEIVLSAPDESVVRDRDVRLETRAAQDPTNDSAKDKSRIRPWGGRARVRTDASGKASAVIAAGTMYASPIARKGDRFFPVETAGVAKPNETASLTILFKPGVLVQGRVQTPEGDPIEGVGLDFAGGEIRSGKDGKFETICPQDRVQGQLRDIPEGFTLPYEAFISARPSEQRQADAEASPKVVELPAIVLRKAVPVSGRVLTPNGQAVANARVMATWVQHHETFGYFTLKSDLTSSDENGQFKLGRVFPGVDAIVVAQTNEMSVVTASKVNTTTPQELTLTVAAEGMISIVGAVQGTDGKPLPQASIKAVSAMSGPGEANYGTRLVEWNGRGDFAAQPDGSIHSPGKVPRFEKYSLTISAPGYLAVETPFLNAPLTAPSLDLGVIQLTKARQVTGVVRDSSGAAVAGAEVWSWAASTDGGRSYTELTKTKTDDAGQFTLDKLHPASALAFATKPEYRTSGCTLSKESTEVSIILFRTSEQIPPEHIVRPIQFDNSQRHPLATKLLQKTMAHYGNSNYFHREILSMLVKANPDAGLDAVRESSSAGARACALARLGEFDDAIAEAESITDAYKRAYCRFEIMDSMNDADQIREHLAATLLDAQAIVTPDRRAVIVAQVADRFSQLGEHDRVATILREELPQVEALSKREWPGFARGYFAAQLARIDPQAALRIASEAEPDDQARHYQNVAHVLAAINPEVAETALGQIKSHRFVDDPAVRVAHRMASVDLERAIRLVDRIDVQQRPTEKARGLGVIAAAIFKSDPQRARELLQRAFTSLPPQHGGSGSRSEDLFGGGLFLLSLAETIDPERLTEYFWFTASLHPGPSGGAWSPDDSLRSDAERRSRLVLLLSLYNVAPELPRQIMQPGFEFWEGQIGSSKHQFTDHKGTFVAMALTDPERAAEWALRFHEKLDEEHRRYIPQPWEVIAQTLTQERSSLNTYITREVFHRWVIDQYD